MGREDSDMETTLQQDLAEWTPDEAIITAAVAVITWLDPVTGEQHWRTVVDSDMPCAATIGMLEMAKLDIIARTDTGLPLRYEED